MLTTHLADYKLQQLYRKTAYQSQVFMSLFLADKLNSAIRRAAFVDQIMYNKTAQTKSPCKHWLLLLLLTISVKSTYQHTVTMLL